MSHHTKTRKGLQPPIGSQVRALYLNKLSPDRAASTSLRCRSSQWLYENQNWMVKRQLEFVNTFQHLSH